MSAPNKERGEEERELDKKEEEEKEEEREECNKKNWKSKREEEWQKILCGAAKSCIKRLSILDKESGWKEKKVCPWRLDKGVEEPRKWSTTKYLSTTNEPLEKIKAKGRV